MWFKPPWIAKNKATRLHIRAMHGMIQYTLKKHLVVLQPCGDAVSSKVMYKIDKSGSLN